MKPLRNNKFFYYIRSLLRMLLPDFYFRMRLKKKLGAIKRSDLAYIQTRVTYYNKLTGIKPLSQEAIQLADLRMPKKLKVYYFDTREYTRYFNPGLRANFLFGDITIIPDEPTIVKSRPITENNQDSVLLKLNKIRHYVFVRDTRSFESKKNRLVGRAVVKVPHRVRFYQMYFNHPLCDLGQINHSKNEHWMKKRLTIREHLDYKFILCIEGHDVATNLKWVMSSNSLAVMPKPKFETWFMEGTLVPNKHYVAIKDDYSDLEERLTYYINHPQEALTIIHHANAYAAQFKDSKREDLISLLVLEKYFNNTGQSQLSSIGSQ